MRRGKNMMPHISRIRPHDLSKLIGNYRKSNSDKVPASLLSLYEPLIQMAADRMSYSHKELFEDLYKEGQLCLMALLTNDHLSFGTHFADYAMKSLIYRMKNFLRDIHWYMQMDQAMKEKSQLVQQKVAVLSAGLNRSPGVEEIAATLDLTIEETIELLACRDQPRNILLHTTA
jgi:RNA polymerase sigma-B factor